MTCFNFNVIVEDMDLDDPVVNRSLTKLPYIAVPSRMSGVTSIEVEIEAATATAAWQQLDVDTHRLHIKIERIDMDLVNVAEIALRLEVNRETVRLWAKGERRQGFPVPFVLASSTSMWRWADVFAWASRDQTLANLLAVTPLPSGMVDVLNGRLAEARLSRRQARLAVPAF